MVMGAESIEETQIKATLNKAEEKANLIYLELTKNSIFESYLMEKELNEIKNALFGAVVTGIKLK